MTTTLGRVAFMLEHARHDMAEREVRQLLAVEPLDPAAHVLLAICLAEGGRYDEATAAAEEAVRLAPDLAVAHFVLGTILCTRGRHDAAAVAVEEAIRLDPNDAGAFALLGQVRLRQRRWTEALQAAELGLALDPEHVTCSNLRALALPPLGRWSEFSAASDAALALDPEDAVAHATRGWASLHDGDLPRALEHFRQSLRREPGLEPARAGLVEALKARSPVYGRLLRLTLWAATLNAPQRMATFFGPLVGFQVLGAAVDAAQAPGLWLVPGALLYGAYVFVTFTADALSNLLLRLNRYGRHVLSREETVASNWVGGCLLTAFLASGATAVTGTMASITATVIALLLTMLVAGVFHCAAGWPRTVMALLTGFVAAAGAASVGLSLASPDAGGANVLGHFAAGFVSSLGGVAPTPAPRLEPEPSSSSLLATVGFLLFLVSLVGAVVGNWASGPLSGITPTPRKVTGTLRRRPLWLVALLSVTTLGWYSRFWFARTWVELHAVRGDALPRPMRYALAVGLFLVTPIPAASFLAMNIAVPVAAGVATVASCVVFRHQRLLRCVVRERGREATLPPWAAAGLFGGGILPGQVWMSLEGRPGLAWLYLLLAAVLTTFVVVRNQADLNAICCGAPGARPPTSAFRRVGRRLRSQRLGASIGR